MKKFGLLILAAIAGSAITLLSYQYLGLGHEKKVTIEHVDGSMARSAVYTLDEKGEVIPLDFTSVANDVMDAVVHIKSTQKVQRPSSRSTDPFGQFFNDDFFEHFFGPQYRFEGPKGKPDSQTRVGSGSGVIISADGYIVTNNHVVNDADDIEVTLHDNRTYKAKLVGKDPSTDLAVLQIKENDLTFVPFMNSDEVEIGEWVLAIGNPFNLNSTVTAGIVSAKARNINILKDKSAIESFIQTDAAINPGNSGGALVDLQGGLIGINTAIASPTGSYAGYGFAVPANMVKKVVYDILEFGTVQRGYLGVMIRDVNAQLAKEKDLKMMKGVYIDSLLQNSAALKSGLKKGDVILEVDGKYVSTAPELQEVIGRHRPGDKVDILIDRQGKEKKYEVVLNNRDGKTRLIGENKENVLDLLGLELENLDEASAAKLNVDGGVRVKDIKAGIIQRETSIKKGFVITKVNDKKVKSVEEFEDLMKGKKGGVMFEGVYENYPGQLYYAFGM